MYQKTSPTKSSNVYQIVRAPFLRKTILFANDERITEVNEFRMTKKYLLRSSGLNILPKRTALSPFSYKEGMTDL